MSVTTVTVSIGPAASPLVLSSECTDVGITWATMSLPEWTLRYNYAPPSAYIPGNVLLSAVQDSGEVLMTVSIQASSLAQMESMKAQVENALAAWPGSFKAEATDSTGTVTIAGPWDTFPTVPGWGEVLTPVLDYYTVDTVFSLPVNPPGAP